MMASGFSASRQLSEGLVAPVLLAGSTITLRGAWSLEFEWDPGKRHANLDKHGIDFRRAIDVFSDPEHINEDATRPEHGEIRAKLLAGLGNSCSV